MAEQRRSASVKDREAGTEAKRGNEDRSHRQEDAPRKSGLPGLDAARMAKEQLQELTGHPADSVSAMTRSDDGWLVRVELVELERVPPTTNVMGSYEVELDGNGELMGYELIRRYHRGSVGGEDQ